VGGPGALLAVGSAQFVLGVNIRDMETQASLAGSEVKGFNVALSGHRAGRAGATALSATACVSAGSPALAGVWRSAGSKVPFNQEDLVVEETSLEILKRTELPSLPRRRK